MLCDGSSSVSAPLSPPTFFLFLRNFSSMLVNSAAEKDHCAKSGELDINSTTFSPSNGQFPSLFNMSTQNSAFHSKDRILNWAILLPHWLKVVDSFFYPRRRRSKYSMTPTVPYTSSGFFPFTKCPNSCISHNYEADTSRNREICIPVLLSGFFDFFSFSRNSNRGNRFSSSLSMEEGTEFTKC